MNFESFFDEVEKQEISLKMKYFNKNNHLLDNEALFQLPLISLIVLIIAKDRRKPYISEIGQLVGECIENSMVAFKSSSQQIGWSANLRVRTVKAVSFLEHTQLIIVYNTKGKLEITDLGKKVIKKALSEDNNLSYNLSQISRSYRNICVKKQLELKII